MDEALEGWYTDPFARHEARWMSQGSPTALVRDGKVEGHDPAPDEPFGVTPERLGDDPGKNNGADLRRADDGEEDDAFETARRPFEVFDQIGPGGI
jgi:hypothetical protein